MDWKQAFLAQAQSDLRLYERLEDARDVEDCHRLHYLQMLTEKLAKSFFSDSGTVADPPKLTHIGLVRLLQQMKGMPQVRTRLGFQDAERFRAYVDSLLPFARQIQSLAPAIAGTAQPNPEYPWCDAEDKSVRVPCQYGFGAFRPQTPHMVRLMRLVRSLVRIAEEV